MVRRQVKVSRFWLAFGLALLSGDPMACEEGLCMGLQPFVSGNKNPFVAIYGLPLGDSAWIMPVARTRWSLNIDVANNFRITGRDEEEIYLDGESVYVRLGWRRGIAQNWDLSVKLP